MEEANFHVNSSNIRCKEKKEEMKVGHQTEEVGGGV